MALGKEIGSWTYKVTSSTYTPGPGGSVTIQANARGRVAGDLGEGEGEGTMTIVVAAPGAKTATWSWCGAVYLNDGSIVATSGQGTSEESGKHKWKFNGTATDSTGRTAAVESEGDFASQTWAGKVFEWR